MAKKALKRAGGVVLIAAVFACTGFAYALTRSPVFAGENYEFSAGASSSAEIVHTDNPALYKLFHAVAGESARYKGDVSEELLARFQARILFIENVCGIVNYYCYSPVLSGGVALGGEVVNLHIAVGECMTAAGTPVIFGGF